MTMNGVDSSCEWRSREQDILLETALQKPLEEIIREYDELWVDNVSLNQSDYVPLQSYSSPEISTNLASEKGVVKKETKTSKSNQERRKTIHWTEDEHRLFLEGLEMYGEGDWKSISRNYVVTRTPTQVASHAQKYKIHQKKERRRRSSIHDVTLEKNGDISVPQGPITCQASYSAANLIGKSDTEIYYY